MMDHDAIRRSIAAYALDSIDAPDRAEVEHELLEHVTGCDDCRTMLRDFREVAADLALSAAPREVSAGLEDRVLAAIRATEPLAAPSGSRRRRSFLRLSAVAAMLALGASWTLSATLIGRVHSAEQENTKRTVAMQQILRSIQDPDARFSALTGSAGTLVASYRTDGSVVLLGEGIPTPSAGRVLELWIMRKGVPVAAGTFVPDSGRVLLRTQVAAGDYQALAVTVERGSVQKPTSTPIYSGTLRA